VVYLVKHLVLRMFVCVSFCDSLSPHEVWACSVDDKTRITLGLVAVNRNQRIAMRTDDPGHFDDHQYPISNHKLIVSVIAGLVFDLNYPIGNPKRLSYQGPTAVTVRSGTSFHELIM